VHQFRALIEDYFECFWRAFVNSFITMDFSQIFHFTCFSDDLKLSIRVNFNKEIEI
jgi:hypothetical protein